MNALVAGVQVAVAVAPLPLRATALHSVVGEPPEYGVEVNVTVPAGVAEVLVLVTLAVKVTLFPFVRGFAVAPATGPQLGSTHQRAARAGMGGISTRNPQPWPPNPGRFVSSNCPVGDKSGQNFIFGNVW